MVSWNSKIGNNGVNNFAAGCIRSFILLKCMVYSKRKIYFLISLDLRALSGTSVS